MFRAFGNVKLVEIPLAQAELELHTNGYTRMNAKFDWGIDGLASLKGFMLFEMMAPKLQRASPTSTPAWSSSTGAPERARSSRARASRSA